MSAYVCEPETFAILAAYAAMQRGPYGYRTIDHAGFRANFKRLYEQNIRSVEARYGNGSDMARGYSVSEDDLARWERIPSTTRPEAVLGAARGYDYQACETRDYRSTEAYSIVRRAVAIASEEICEAAGVHGWTYNSANLAEAARGSMATA